MYKNTKKRFIYRIKKKKDKDYKENYKRNKRKKVI